MRKPDFAQARSDVAIALWRKCVTDKAASWSRLKDDATAVAAAAVTACEPAWAKVRNVLIYLYESKGLSDTEADDPSGKLHNTMKDVGIKTVIAERAKLLPKK